MKLSLCQFKEIVSESLDSLPAALKNALENVVVLVEEWPSKDQLDYCGEVDHWSLLGLYEGVPKIERLNYNLTLPDRITLFRRPLEKITNSRLELISEIKQTVLHEIGHHFGLTEEELI